MNTKVIYCGNCGKKGHVYRNCYKPIQSLGILCIKYDGLNINDAINYNKNNNKIFNKYVVSNISNNYNIKNMVHKKLKFLMVCRKHSLGYIELIRGNYNVENYSDINYIENMFKLMTKNEIENVEKKDFDFLWNNLWILQESFNSHKKEYEQSKYKFNKLINGVDIIFNEKKHKIILDYFISYFYNNKIKWIEPEWEFPKGRRNIKEEDLSCAIREFEEETDFKSEEYKLLNLNPISEIFMGNNGINYKHIYYLAQSFNKSELKINDDNIFQKIEISDIKWFTFSEAMEKIREYNTERKEVLKKVFNLLYFNIYHFLTKEKNLV